ncbi:glycoside hydrolase family protein [Salix suchowensis]|nr:glycoside hydrolase family protein [Salix suchowensis]
MALAATGSTDLAEELTKASGKELASVGVHWPTAQWQMSTQIHTTPSSTLTRSLASCKPSPMDCSGFVAPCAKHFPGHGDTNVDSHLALPVISKSRNDLYSNELIPFQRLISSGIPSIMTAHVALPEITGSLVPASLSRQITTDLLRTEMQYNGVIVTDCLEMDAVMKTYGSERAALESLKAGADIAMICHTLDKQIGAVELVWEAVRSGELSLDELQKSSRRIEQLKRDFAGSWDDFLSTSSPDEAFAAIWSQLLDENKLISQQGYQRSTTIIRNPPSVLPLSSTDTVLLFTPIMESLNRAVDDAEDVLRTANGLLRNTKGASYTAFASAIARRRRCSTSFIPINFLPFLRTHRPSSYLPCAMPTAAPGKSTVSETYYSSSEGEHYFAFWDCTEDIDLENIAHLASFEFTIPALETAASVIFGEIPAQGDVPVTIT